MAVPQLISVEKLASANLKRGEKFFLHFTPRQLTNLKKSLTTTWPLDRIPAAFLQLHIIPNPDGAIAQFRCRKGCVPLPKPDGSFTCHCPDVGEKPPQPFPGQNADPCTLVVNSDGSLSCKGSCVRKKIGRATVRKAARPPLASIACKLYGKKVDGQIVAFCACPVPKRPVIRLPQ